MVIGSDISVPERSPPPPQPVRRALIKAIIKNNLIHIFPNSKYFCATKRAKAFFYGIDRIESVVSKK